MHREAFARGVGHAIEITQRVRRLQVHGWQGNTPLHGQQGQHAFKRRGGPQEAAVSTTSFAGVPVPWALMASIAEASIDAD